MGFKEADDLFLGRNFAAFQHPCARLADHLRALREEVVHGQAQAFAAHALANAGAQASKPSGQALLHLPSLLDDLLGGLDQLLRELTLLGFHRLAFAAHQTVERPQRVSHRAAAVAKGVPYLSQRGACERLGTLDQAREHPDSIAEQAAIGRMRDGRLHHRPVDPEFAGPRDPRLERQLGRPIVQVVQGLWLDGLRPARAAW
jgi:hypothetical protein